jgi:hypothetical protein
MFGGYVYSERGIL